MSENAFVGPRSRDTARALIDAATEIGLDPQVVLTTTNGYLVPVEVVDHIDEEKAKAEAAEAERKAAAKAAADAIRAAADKAEKEAAEKAAANEAAKAEAEKASATKRATRAPRSTKASSAGEEKS